MAVAPVLLPSAAVLYVTPVVPTLTTPPFAAPLAEVEEPSARTMALPCKVTCPPFADKLAVWVFAAVELVVAATTGATPPLAAILPVWLIFDATSSMTPPLFTIEEADTRPELLIVEAIN